MNLSKNLLFSVILIASISTTSCKKFIDYVNHHPNPATTTGCKIVSVTEQIPFDIFRTGYDSCQYQDNCIIDNVRLSVVYKVYYNSMGNPDSITWKPFGRDTVRTSSNGYNNLYFKYDAQGKLTGTASKSSYSNAALSTLKWDTYTYPDAKTIKLNGTGVIKLDDSMRVISEGETTYEYDSNGNLQRNPYNNFNSNEIMSDAYGSNERLTYTLDKTSPRQLNWVFMFIDRDFSKNASELFSDFNSNGYAQVMDGKYPSGFQDVFLGSFSNLEATVSTNKRTIQYSCTETPPSKK